jgi:phosphopantothenate synthetase
MRNIESTATKALRRTSRAAFHAGLFLDGSMQLEVNGVQVALIAEQVAQLARLLRGVPA